MADNVLVITDPDTGDVLRVVVPDHDAQLDEAIFHSNDEVATILPMDEFLAHPDLQELKAVVSAART